MEEEDRALARALQEEYDHELSSLIVSADEETSGPPSLPNGTKSKSIVDPAWELVDPNPDIRMLFQEFNALYFWGKLSMVEVKWSPRMTLCAGVCSYEGRGGLCSVRLSQPLLRLRPRKDLVETLLHEMIHAYLFVTANNKDHDGHGPEFQKHMHRINAKTGSNITIYHSFHDEVAELRQHWWRCQGPCQNRPPYWGYVKRATNRAPSANDPWWAQHQRACGGTYIKIKEPENYGKKKGKENKPVSKGLGDISSFFGKTDTSQKQGETSNSMKLNDEKRILGGTPLLQNGNSFATKNDTNGRGIPLHSRLLQQNSSSGAIKRDNNGLAVPLNGVLLQQDKGKFDDSDGLKEQVDDTRTLEGIWGDLLAKKRKNESSNVHTPTAKHKSKAHDISTRLKRKGRKSVNAGAPAFIATPPLTKRFNKKVISFTDSEDERDTQSDKENCIDNLIPMDREIKNSYGKLLKSSDINHNLSSPIKCKDHGSVTKDIEIKKSDRPKSLLPVKYTDSIMDSPEAVRDSKSPLSCSDINHNCSTLSSRKRLPSFSDDETILDNSYENEMKGYEPERKKSKVTELDEEDDENSLPEFKLTNSRQRNATSADISDQPGCSREINTNPVMVGCPICDNLVEFSSLNSHIDDCLSIKAIKDSSFY